MKSAMLDTNILIDFLERSDFKVAEMLQSFDELVLTPVVIGEYLAGIRPGKNGEIAKARFEDFLDDVSVKVVWMTKATGRRYAELYQRLKAKGTPIPVNDMWIAASAMENDLMLISNDAHFAQVDDLRFAAPETAQEGGK